MHKHNIIKKPATNIHSFRCTDEEWEGLKNLAKECGTTVSRYLVEASLKHHPRQRLKKEEVEALNSLAIARTDLKNIANVLQSKSDEEKQKYFRSEKFMRWWVDAVAKLIRHWYSIEENITTVVLPKSKENL